MIDGMKMEVSGVDALANLAKNVAPKKARNSLRSALGQAATLLLQTARPLVPQTTRQATGLLRKSLGKKDSKPNSKGIYSIVGPRRGFKQVIVPKSTKRRQARDVRAGRFRVAAKGRVKNPVRYAHLVEKGHKMRNGGMVRGRPFLMAARLIARQQMADTIQRVLINRLVEDMKFDAGTGA